ncbi:M56 family peptidase [Paenibacillus albiflavus]|uniref:M56 family peptidase n=1 Tax=Paenibacillus albiflavus TaxID=2545760 RepID=A0A4V2WPV7_9BACL|nr:M56 family metallopeptidase [Paenibacillus albiflavus]TCZ80842.1 M56 family peptidase [Paenibacillus albiflavus]
MSHIVKMKLMYVLMIFFVGMLIIQMGFVVTHQIRDISSHNLAITYILFDLVLVYALSRIIWRVARQWYLSRHWLRIFRAETQSKLTKELNYKYRSWGTEIIVVQDDAFIALTMGMLRPKIIISTGVIRLFDEREVQAILLHEWFHCRNHDNPKLFLSTLLVDAFGYLPIIKPVFHYYKICKELLADRFAIKQMGTELHLGNVLMKLIKLGEIQRREIAVHFTESAIDYRIMQILEPDKTVKVQIALLRPLLLSCLFLILMMIGGSGSS